MKRKGILLLVLFMAALPLIAQEVDGSFAFVNANEEIIENGSTIICNTVTDEEGIEFINSDISVKNISATMSDYIRIIYTISQLDNGEYQIAIHECCYVQRVVGEYMTGSGRMMGTLQNIQSCWLPVADGSCVVSLQIEVLTKYGFSYIHKAYGPTITIEFVKGDIPGPDPITLEGDMNADGIVSISDVSALIDYLLGVDDDTFNIESGDMNGNNRIDIADVTLLIDKLLQGS